MAACLLCEFNIADTTVQGLYNHYADMHEFSMENDYLLNYLSSLCKINEKYTRTCRYCQRKCHTRRSYTRHMMHYHHQLGGGGVSSGSKVKLKVSPTIKDVGKGGISFRTFSYKASPRLLEDDDKLHKAAVNPYDLGSLDILFDDLEIKLTDLSKTIDTDESILINGTFGVDYKRPIADSNGVEIGHPQTYSLPSYDLSTVNAFGIKSALTPMKGIAMSSIGNTTQGGSRWAFHKILFLSINVITVPEGTLLNEFIVGGKRRGMYKNNPDMPDFNNKKARMDYYKTCEFLQMEADVSGNDGNSDEDSDEETSASAGKSSKLTAEDIDMIDDREVDEEYCPINYLDVFDNDKKLVDNLDFTIIDSSKASEGLQQKMAEADEKDKKSIISENKGLNLDTGLNLSDFEVNKSMLDRLRAKQHDAIDHNLKPVGDCAYYSIIMGILHAQLGKPTALSWRQPWKECEAKIDSRVLEIVRGFKKQLNFCLLSTLMYTLQDLNVLLVPFDILISLYKVKPVVNFVRLFTNSKSKYVKNHVSLFQKVYLPIVESSNVSVIQLTISPNTSTDFELSCSFVRDIHNVSVILSCERDDEMREMARNIENIPTRVGSESGDMGEVEENASDIDDMEEESKTPLRGQIGKLYTCELCMTKFIVKKSFLKHSLSCNGPGSTQYVFPDESYTYFDHQSKTDPPPFDIFFDTETPTCTDTLVEPTLLLGSYPYCGSF